MRRHLFWSVPLIVASAVQGQQTLPTPASANHEFHSVNGVVIDSLHQRPLVGASVVVTGTSRFGTTDSSGIFRIDSLERGTYKLGVYHPYLDSLRVALVTNDTPIPLAEGKRLIVGIPSASTLIGKTCPASVADASSLLMGTVIDAETGVPIPNAKVTVSWAEYIFGKKIRGLQKMTAKIEVTSSATGVYRVCGVPADIAAAVVARSGDVATDEIGINSTSPSVMMLTLAISRNLSVRVPVSGFVRDDRGGPLRNARVQMVGTNATAVTAENGSFTLNDVPPGTRTLAVRRIGYIPVSTSIQLTTTSIPPVEIRLYKSVPIIDTVYIRGRRSRGLESVGFARRKVQGVGEFFTREQIEKHNPLLLTDALKYSRQITIKSIGTQAVVVPRRNYGCVKLWVDGAHWRLIEPRDINDFIQASEISAIEIFGGATVPPEFETDMQHGCLTIVVWSRTRVGDLPR